MIFGVLASVYSNAIRNRKIQSLKGFLFVVVFATSVIIIIERISHISHNMITTCVQTY